MELMNSFRRIILSRGVLIPKASLKKRTRRTTFNMNNYVYQRQGAEPYNFKTPDNAPQ